MPSKKASQKTFQKLVLAPIWGSKTPPKSKKNPFKNHVKKRSEKNYENFAHKTHLGKPVLARNGKREDILE